MTSKEIIRRFRSQWREMAKLGIKKEEYFERHPNLYKPVNSCWLCEYTKGVARSCCLINWNTKVGNYCNGEGSLYLKWSRCIYNRRIKRAKELALAISKLPKF
jgi:hypothetical protein